LGGMIFGVFRQIAVGTCLGNSIDDARTLFLLAPAKPFLQLLIPGQSHRDLVHICITFSDRRAPCLRMRRHTKRKRSEPLATEPFHSLSGQYSKLYRFFICLFSQTSIMPQV